MTASCNDVIETVDEVYLPGADFLIDVDIFDYMEDQPDAFPHCKQEIEAARHQKTCTEGYIETCRRVIKFNTDHLL